MMKKMYAGNIEEEELCLCLVLQVFRYLATSEVQGIKTWPNSFDRSVWESLLVFVFPSGASRPWFDLKWGEPIVCHQTPWPTHALFTISLDRVLSRRAFSSHQG